jgi:hypothetical protein
MEVAPWASSSEALFTPLLSGTGLHGRRRLVTPVTWRTVTWLIRLVWPRYPSQSGSLGTPIVRHEGREPVHRRAPHTRVHKGKKVLVLLRDGTRLVDKF